MTTLGDKQCCTSRDQNHQCGNSNGDGGSGGSQTMLVLLGELNALLGVRGLIVTGVGGLLTLVRRVHIGLAVGRNTRAFVGLAVGRNTRTRFWSRRAD